MFLLGNVDNLTQVLCRGKSNYQEAECNIEKVAGSVWTGWNFIKAMEGAIE